MSYRIARSLEVLRTRINDLSPNRSTISDGWIGDPSHRTRDSDHNPWVAIQSGPEKGTRVVTALDITHDPKHGVDCEILAWELAQSKDPRIKYLIWNSRIVAGQEGPKPWTWRKYGGVNPHNRHMHISVEDNEGHPGLFDTTEPWDVDLGITEEQAEAPPAPPKRPTLKRGSKGEPVIVLQRLLNAEGYGLGEDGNFGPKTDRAVRHFQTSQGAKADGIVGPYTWELLES